MAPTRTLWRYLALYCIVFVAYKVIDYLTKSQPLEELEFSVVVLQRGNGIETNSFFGDKKFMHLKDTKIDQLFPKTKTFQTRTVNSSKNAANIYVWNEICGSELRNLLNYPLFPNLPTSRNVTTSLHFPTIPPASDVRVFGFFYIKTDGVHHFKLESLNLNIRVYISVNKTLLLKNHLEEKSYASGEMFFQRGKYYFEILSKTDRSLGSFNLFWRTPGAKAFSTIENLYLHHNENNLHKVLVNGDTNHHMFSIFNQKNVDDIVETASEHKRSRIFEIPFAPEEDFENLFPECDYEPSYLFRKTLSRFAGVWNLHYTSVFPDDNTHAQYRLTTNQDQLVFGNDVISQDKVNKLVIKVMHKIKEKTERKYLLSSILNIEENVDMNKGSRFLVELELTDLRSSTEVRFSRYIYQPLNDHQLCYPAGLRWNKTADVNVIITVANQGRWIKHFIDTMSRIYAATQDEHFNVIIVDFNSEDIDLRTALRQSGLPRYTLIEHTGKFHKTSAINAAVKSIKDDHAITLQVDLHLTIPSNFIDHVRKHTIEGRMTCSPLLFRLQCGASPHARYGFWESAGYGIFGAYKSDWMHFGGMDTNYRFAWGGEDWALVDSVLGSGYEIERIKMKNFNHVFHSKKGMWNSKNKIIFKT